MLSIRTLLRPTVSNLRYCRLLHTNNKTNPGNVKTIINIPGVDSNSTKVSLFNRVIHKFSISFSLIKKIIACVILYIMMDSIFIPLYNFKQNASKWIKENNIEF
uniref:Uncharacterized protein n=1 Tax=viral metagenome TaxID=1070528 RepID=A0A6C0C631_9ZZZZ